MPRGRKKMECRDFRREVLRAGEAMKFLSLIQCRHNILSHMNIAPICTEAMNEDAFFA